MTARSFRGVFFKYMQYRMKSMKQALSTVWYVWLYVKPFGITVMNRRCRWDLTWVEATRSYLKASERYCGFGNMYRSGKHIDTMSRSDEIAAWTILNTIETSIVKRIYSAAVCMVSRWVETLRYMQGESSAPQRDVLSTMSVYAASVVLRSIEASGY